MESEQPACFPALVTVKSAILNREIANFHNTTGEFVDNGKVQSNRF
jgi:hypothetical protein